MDLEDDGDEEDGGMGRMKMVMTAPKSTKSKENCKTFCHSFTPKFWVMVKNFKINEMILVNYSRRIPTWRVAKVLSKPKLIDKSAGDFGYKIKVQWSTQKTQDWVKLYHCQSMKKTMRTCVMKNRRNK